MRNNQQLHVLCNHRCLPYVFSNPISKKYIIVFLNLDLHKIVNNSRFLSLLGEEATSLSQVVFKKLEIYDLAELTKIATHIKLVTNHYDTSYLPIEKIHTVFTTNNFTNYTDTTEVRSYE